MGSEPWVQGQAADLELVTSGNSSAPGRPSSAETGATGRVWQCSALQPAGTGPQSCHTDPSEVANDGYSFLGGLEVKAGDSGCAQVIKPGLGLFVCLFSDSE